MILNQKKNQRKSAKMLNFFLIVHKNFPKISRELQKFPGNCREMRFTGISRDFPGGISREPALMDGVNSYSTISCGTNSYRQNSYGPNSKLELRYNFLRSKFRFKVRYKFLLSKFLWYNFLLSYFLRSKF